MVQTIYLRFAALHPEKDVGRVFRVQFQNGIFAAEEVGPTEEVGEHSLDLMEAMTGVWSNYFDSQESRESYSPLPHLHLGPVPVGDAAYAEMQPRLL